MSKCICYIKTLKYNKVQVILLSVNNKDVDKRIITEFNLSPEAYMYILDNLHSSTLLLEINNGEVTDVNIPDDNKYKIRDSNDIIKEILNNNNKEMDKGTFFKVYSDITNTTLRTAQNHLYEAIEKGIVESIGGVHGRTIKLKDDKVNDENLDLNLS